MTTKNNIFKNHDKFQNVFIFVPKIRELVHRASVVVKVIAKSVDVLETLVILLFAVAICKVS